MVLRKLKRLLGLDSSSENGRSERDVTVQQGEDADTGTESGVTGVDEDGDGAGDGDEETPETDEVSDDDDASEIDGDEAADPVAAGTDADASTDSLVDEEAAQDDPTARAEPAEAAGQDDEEAETDAEETTDAGDEQAAADDSASVDEVKGIGPAYSERLGEIGIETVDDLAAADAADVAERTTVPEKTVRKWIDRAADHE
ncbi:MAG: helix-hairpin-helix domain-containing protein [Halolamina sp.]